MKLFSQFFLFCFFVVLSLVFLDSASAAKFRGYGNSSNDSAILDGDFQKQDIRFSDAMLLSDGNAHGIEEDGDVKIVRSGPINLTLTEEKLEFEVCDCEGTSTICYESFDSTANLCGGFSSCEFKVKSNITNWVVGPTLIYKNLFPGCLQTLMKSPVAEISSTYGFPSCNPKMDDNKMIKLHASINPRCYIKVKNAKLYVPIIPTTSTTKVPSPAKSPQKDTSEASFPDWGYIIIGIVILIAIAAIIGFVVFYLYKKRRTSKRASQKPDGTKPKPTVFKADITADVKTPTKKNDDLEAVKVEQTQMPKKEKKPKTLEPTTAEDVPENKKKTKTLEPKITEDAPAPP
uniref:Uncharacterized protein n=1 Tax=Panagrolaimus davidi TaxID=227884 RepID=A0A914PW23_9BILA